MISARVAKALLSQGCSAEQIVAAVSAIDEDREARLARLREGAAERMRRHREKKRLGAASVTRNAASPPSPKESFPHTPFKEITPTPGEGAPARETAELVEPQLEGRGEAHVDERPAPPYGERLEGRVDDRPEARRDRSAGAIPGGRRLPADFSPSLEDFAFGRAEGLSEAEIARTLEDLRLWAAESVGPKALRADWHAAFRRFLRRDGEAKRAGRPPPVSWRPPMAEGAAAARTVHVRRDSPQGDAWWAFVKGSTGRTPPMDRAGGWFFPSAWPPKLAQTSERRHAHEAAAERSLCGKSDAQGPDG